MAVSVCVCVCVCWREGREGESLDTLLGVH